MKDLNTAIFLFVLGIILLVACIAAPIYSMGIRWLLGMMSVASFYMSYAMYFAKDSRLKNLIIRS